jgi:hypothetical protein
MLLYIVRKLARIKINVQTYTHTAYVNLKEL